MNRKCYNLVYLNKITTYRLFGRHNKCTWRYYQKYVNRKGYIKQLETTLFLNKIIDRPKLLGFSSRSLQQNMIWVRCIVLKSMNFIFNCGFILCITIWTPPLEMGTHHYHFRCNMVTRMIRPPDRWASLVYPHHCRRPRGTSAGNRTLSAADNRRCQATCQFRWVAYPSSRHRRTFLADGIPGPSVRTSTWGRTDGR